VSIGPTWGDAHIDVHADTASLRRELRVAAAEAGKEFGTDWGEEADSSLGREMSVLGRHVENGMRKGGRTSGTNWAKEFEDEVGRRLKRADLDLVNAGVTGDWSKVIGRFGNLEEAITGVRQRFDEMAKSSDLSKASIQDLNGSFDAFTTKIRHDDAFGRMQVEAEEMNRSFKASAREIADEASKIEKSFHDDEDAAFRLNKQFDRDQTVKYREGLAQTRRESSALHFEITKMLKAHDDEDRALQKVRDSAHDLALEWERGGHVARRGISRVTGALSDYEGHVSVLGRLAGSRNNFLNLVGIAAGGAETAIGNFVDKLAEIPDKFANLGQVAASNGGGVGGFFAAIGSLFSGGGDITSLVKAAVAMAAFTAAVEFGTFAVGQLVTLLSGLVAILTALAGSVVLGAISALGVLGAGALALAGGVGALVVAFAKMDDATKQLYSDALKPITGWFNDLGKTINAGFLTTLTGQIDGIKSVLNGFVGPLLLSSATALQDVFSYFVAAFNRPEVQQSLSVLLDYLPGILSNLGQAFVDFTTGLIGFFATLAPYALTISQSLADAAVKFSDLANASGADGQSPLQMFLAIANDSLNSILDLTGKVGTALLDLFVQVAPTGNDFLASITGIVQQFDDWVNSEDGRQQISDWMAFARDLADLLWQSVQKIGQMIDDLDTPQNRASLLGIIGMFNGLLDWIDKVIVKMSAIPDAIGRAANAFHAFESVAANTLGRIAGTINNIIDAVGRLISALGRIRAPSALHDIGSALGNLASALPLGATGMITSGPTIAGEAGREAIVPLERPLSQVDPSVRWLAAIAQGRGGNMGAQTAPSTTKVIEQGAIQVIYPGTDGRIAASMLLDAIAERM
jgi:hypothetical protein